MFPDEELEVDEELGVDEELDVEDGCPDDTVSDGDNLEAPGG